MAKLGWVGQRNLRIELRFGGGDADRVRAYAAELANLAPDAIVTQSLAATRAVQQQTQTIPIVITGVGDPIANGLVKSIARPDGNITGSTILGGDLGAKRLQLLKEAIPRVSHVAFLWNPQNASNRVQLENVLVRARALELTLLPVQASGPDDLDSAFAAMMKKRPDALMITADPLQQLFVGRIVQLAAVSPARDLSVEVIRRRRRPDVLRIGYSR
jgi:putative ABC transport system substrate-binding protein